MTLTLRCIRCGDLDEMHAQDFAAGLCTWCWLLRPIPGTPERRRWERWMKHQERHPTYKALTAVLELLEAVPPGTLDTGDA